VGQRTDRRTSSCLQAVCSNSFRPKTRRSVKCGILRDASGSGKSHIAKGVAERYMKQFPDRDVYLVSKLEEDETLDNMKGRKCHSVEGGQVGSRTHQGLGHAEGFISLYLMTTTPF